MSLLIKHGLVVTATNSYEADVFIDDGKISVIGKNLSQEYSEKADEIIDATGKYILPGAIDPHTHFDMPFMGTKSADDFLTGTIAAACGGITAVIDFEVLGQGVSIKDALAAKRRIAEGKAVIDFGVHPCITEVNEGLLAEIADAVSVYGTPSLKLFMTYSFRADDYMLLKILDRAKECSALVQLHAENHFMMQYLNEKFEKEGKLSPYYHAMSRPNIAEEEAVQRAIYLLELTDSQLYIVHLSSQEGLKRLSEARSKGLSVYAETCPQYLLLDDDCYKEEKWGGAKYVMSPPLRTKESNNALWGGIANGDIQTIGSDHCPFNFNGTKDMFGRDDYKKIPNGAPGVETILMLMHSEGVLKGKISLEKMVEVTSTNTAKIFGMKNKGEIAVGKDADIVIFDQKQKFVIECQKMHMNVDYNPYEGKEITGMPYMVFSRGNKVAEWSNDRVEFVGKVGAGKYIKREAFKK